MNVDMGREAIIHFSASAWRARTDTTLTDENVVRAADALARVWTETCAGATVLVGYDTRERAAWHAKLAGKVMSAYGLHVVLSDKVIPTPALAWAACHDPACEGALMFTGAQASAGWSSMLVRGSDGGPASASFLASVERAVDGKGTRERGSLEQADLMSAYLTSLLNQVSIDSIAQTAPLVVADSLYGSTAHVLGSLLEQAGARVHTIHDAFAHDFGKLTPNPVEPWVDEAEQLVSASGARCGIVLGGDGVRFALIDEQGNIVDPHTAAGLLLGHISDHYNTTASSDRRVVTTMASSARIRRKAKLLGHEVTVVPVGFDRLYGEICEGDVLFASEEYGGICLPSHMVERDGLLMALQVLEMLAEHGRTVSEEVRAFEREVGHMSYGRRDIRLDPARIQSLRNILPGLNPERVAGKSAVVVNHADGLSLLFDDDSWVMLRPARTQHVVRVYAEAPSMQQREELIQAATELAHHYS